MIHELGHGLGLYHTFQGDGGGGGCPTNTDCTTEGDEVCDTPPHDRTSGCPSGTNNACGTVRDNHMHNFMDYSDDDCQTEFTADQKTRARAFLTGSRPGLLTSAGCTEVAVPISEFTSECGSASGCVGSSIQFYDISSYDPNSWSWTFTGGTPATSTDKNPLITYNTAGTYEVALEATNDFGTGITETKTGYITIYEMPNAACIPGIQNIGFYGYSFSNVSFGDIDNETAESDNGYSDFSCVHVSTFTEGLDYDLSITVGNNGGQAGFYDCFIDYNDDGVFSAEESILSGGTAAGSGFQTVVKTVTIPTDAVENDLLRMRVINDQSGLSGPCDNLFTGESEDYGVLINPVTILPIELINLNVLALENKTVKLDWQTASEVNNDFFTIERSSDGKNWEAVKSITGAGNSSSIKNYTSIDKFPYYDVSYYRLKQTDFDGEFTYSKVTSVNIKNSQIAIFPNPTEGKLTITGNDTDLEQIKVYNVLGQDVTAFTKTISSKSIQLILDLSELNSGVYFVKTKTSVNKIYKQ